MTLDIEKYLARIGIAGRESPTAEFLARLQEAHLRTVPYENCEIFFGKRVPSLEPEKLYGKIVDRRRGGYCFELNGAFALLLAGCGFTFTESFARWCFGETAVLPPRRHRVLLVRIGKETWIADAGIGSPCPLTPLRLETDVIQERNGLKFRILRDPLHGFLVQRETSEGFVNYFSFWETPHFPQDFLYVNHYCATEENSFFRTHLLVNLAAADGRRSVFMDPGDPGGKDFIFRRERPGLPPLERRIPRSDEKVLAAVLAENFGIDPAD